ncbi:hypothetical protein [Phenylobacterium montanum]|uniref:Uncharacterized protein n=1 Tax=Phenylobacterium montanum TaxID=2823693 RepID=A0A975FY48_9CAUL|nr:hypothetical protein [Caulobacter sp. S6]QUD86967.1 hypothetical protein KCG34_18090 [Caulobacter sp. S6]
MGAKNLDRIPLSEWRRTIESVWDMMQARWEVATKCRTCGLMMSVDLDLITWISGSRTSLWNKHPRCRRLGCAGFVDFMAKPPGRSNFEPLVAEWPRGSMERKAWRPETIGEIVLGPRRLAARCRRCNWSRVLDPGDLISRYGADAPIDQIAESEKGRCTHRPCEAGLRLVRARRKG